MHRLATTIREYASRTQGAVKLTLTGEDSVRLEPDEGPMTIEAPTADMQYSPFHMLGGSLAHCTFSVLYSWATHANLPIDGMVIDVSWTFGGDPKRVDQLRLTFKWPSLPPARLNAAKRVAAMCTVHETLHHSTHVSIETA